MTHEPIKNWTLPAGVADAWRLLHTLPIIAFDMNKITHIIFTLTFTVVCFGLWAALFWFQSIFEPMGIWLPEATRFLMDNRLLFLIIPIPFWVFSFFTIYGRQPASESTLLYFSIVAFLYFFMYVVVIFAVMLPLIGQVSF
jgi:hypothetical protein